MNENQYSSKRRVLLQIKELNGFHLQSNIDKLINKKNELMRMYYIFKKIENKFSIIESYIQSIELKDKMTYEDYLVLSNYKFILSAKNLMANKQLLIYNYIKEKEYIKYSRLFYFEDKLGISSLDFVVLYNKYTNLNIEWKQLVSNIVSNYGEFYYEYFIFFSLYTFILNFNPTLDYNHNSQLFNQLAFKIKKFNLDFNLG